MLSAATRVMCTHESSRVKAMSEYWGSLSIATKRGCKDSRTSTFIVPFTQGECQSRCAEDKLSDIDLREERVAL